MNTNTRGGKREGAGRPKTLPNGRHHFTVNVSLPDHIIEYLRHIPHGNKSKFIAEAVELYVEANDGLYYASWGSQTPAELAKLEDELVDVL